MQSSLASKIKFIRSDRYADKLRDYKIFANGILRGKISRNSIFEFEVPSGQMTLQGRIDWARSKPLQIDIKPGESITVEISNEWSPLLALWAITFGSGNYLTLTRMS